MKSSLARKLAESGIMIAFATILSLLKLVELPYGGSITFASMLPIMIIAYRHGVLWGLLTGGVHGAIQLLLGSSVLSYATSWQAAIAIILLDYIFAFMFCGIAGAFRKVLPNPSSLALGAFVACFIRYLMHVISGCTVWAGLSIPTSDGLIYSLIYNATYMLPETIVTVVAAAYITSVIDFSQEKLSFNKRSGSTQLGKILGAVAGLAVLVGVTVLSVLVFPHLQNAETGEFDITGISSANTTAIIVTVAVAAVIAIVALITKKAISASKKA